MGAIVGFFTVIVLLAVGIYFTTKPTIDYPSEQLFTDYNHEYEKRKALFSATRKSLKLNMMQMKAFRAMEEAAERHSERSWEIPIFYEDKRR